MNLNVTVGQIIKQLRTESGLTQQVLADELGVSRATLAGYEIGIRQISLETLIALSKFFEVSTDYLLGLDI